MAEMAEILVSAKKKIPATCWSEYKGLPHDTLLNKRQISMVKNLCLPSS